MKDVTLKASTLISSIEADLAAGHSAVIQIVSTGTGGRCWVLIGAQ